MDLRSKQELDSEDLQMRTSKAKEVVERGSSDLSEDLLGSGTGILRPPEALL